MLHTQHSTTTLDTIAFGAVQCTWVHMYQMTPDAVASGVVVDICVRRLREEINA